jgi:Transposase
MTHHHIPRPVALPGQTATASTPPPLVLDPHRRSDVAILFRTHGDKRNRSSQEVCAMSKAPMKKYPAECKERAVKLAVETDQPIAQTARDLGVNEHTLHTWIGT